MFAQLVCGVIVSFQFLQGLNIMDYSLLVGIHDPSLPCSADVEENDAESDEDDKLGSMEHGDSRISSDEIPNSPSSATGWLSTKFLCTSMPLCV